MGTQSKHPIHKTQPTNAKSPLPVQSTRIATPTHMPHDSSTTPQPKLHKQCEVLTNTIGSKIHQRASFGACRQTIHQENKTQNTDMPPLRPLQKPGACLQRIGDRPRVAPARGLQGPQSRISLKTHWYLKCTLKFHPEILRGTSREGLVVRQEIPKGKFGGDGLWVLALGAFRAPSRVFIEAPLLPQ